MFFCFIYPLLSDLLGGQDFYGWCQASIITATFAHRNTEKKLPIRYEEEVINGMQKLWDRHLTGLGKYQQELSLPKNFIDVIEEINTFVMNLD